MNEALRFILYPFGLIATLLFGARFLIQWILSEKKKISLTPKNFWKISLAAHIFMFIHSWIQVQYPVCLIQSVNATLAWRNLNLMSDSSYSYRKMLYILGLVSSAVTVLFLIQGIFSAEGLVWMRAPKLFGKNSAEGISIGWHVLGITGLTLFASRFWLQWILAEKIKKSFLPPSFWWLSLCGAFLCLIYFSLLGDPVNILGYSVGLIPYARNLFLLKREKLSKKLQKGSFFIFAGEKSGDILGAELIRSLRESSPSFYAYGVGGQKMREAGLIDLIPLEAFQVMGITAVIKKLPSLFLNYIKIKKSILKELPEAVILIDYPDFNMRLASALKKKKYPGKIIQYVCPSVWAWRKQRITPLSQNLDLLLSILPFEKKLFQHTKLPVEYVGHPLVQVLKNYSYDMNWKEKVGLLNNGPLIALFPGSRLQEIEHNLLIQLESVFLLSQKKEVRCAISIAHPKLESTIRQIIHHSPLKKNIILVPAEMRYEMMKEADAAIATCGTVILELGLHHTPTVVTYRLSPLNYIIGRYLFKILLPSYNLINILCESLVFPEFVHKNIDPQKVAQALYNLTFDPETKEKAIEGCKKTYSLLESFNASERAAHKIHQTLV